MLTCNECYLGWISIMCCAIYSLLIRACLRHKGITSQVLARGHHISLSILVHPTKQKYVSSHSLDISLTKQKNDSSHLSNQTYIMDTLILISMDGHISYNFVLQPNTDPVQLFYERPPHGPVGLPHADIELKQRTTPLWSSLVHCLWKSASSVL
jgi:hypothetical protein